MNRRTFWLGLMVCLLAPGLVRADSIWQRHNFFHSFLFVDNIARRAGDIVTVNIVENTGIEHKDNRNLNKTHEAGGGLAFKGSITGATGSGGSGVGRSAGTDLSIDANSNRSFTGNSAYNINQTFTDTVTCTVIAVQPNGNLIIEGYRRRVVAREVRTLRLTGVIRPIDINIDNTIPSTFVANFQIQYVGQGIETKFTNPGWFGKVVNTFWPF